MSSGIHNLALNPSDKEYFEVTTICFNESVLLPFRNVNFNIVSGREHGQGTVEELRSRDFRKELEDRERTDKDKGSGRRAIELSRESTASSTKRQKLDQVPAASLDADDPLDEDESDSDSDEDDTAALLAELQRIKKERAAEQAKKVNIKSHC